MASWEFPVTEPLDVRIRIPDGDITVTARPAQTVTVEIEGNGRDDLASAVKVSCEAGVLSIAAPGRSRIFSFHSPAFDVTVGVPPGSSCQVDTAAADLRCRGELGALTARTASGDVTADQVTGRTEVSTASGDVRLSRSGPASVKTVSGDVRVGTAASDVTAVSVSGDVVIDQVTRGEVNARTTSGDITVGVAPGLSVQLDLSTLSGDASSELESSATAGDVAATVTCHSISGDVRLRRASSAVAS